MGGVTRSTMGFGVLVLFSLGVAAYALVGYGLLPLGELLHPDMRAVFAANQPIVYTHIFGSALALALGPFQFHAGLRSRRPQLHRHLGRLYLGIGVLAGGLTGLFMARQAFGGALAQWGFTGLALLWLFTGARAYLSIRARDIAAHRRWMLRNFALTLAAVTLRLYLPTSAVAGIPFEQAYPVIAWACWVPNLLIVEWYIRQSPNVSQPAGKPA